MMERVRLCKYCGKPIVMIKVSPNKTVPCDAEAVTYWQSAAGTTSIVTPNGETLKADLQSNSRGEAAVGYIAHRSVCPPFYKGGAQWTNLSKAHF